MGIGWVGTQRMVWSLAKDLGGTAGPRPAYEYERHDLGHGVFFHQIFELIYLF